MGCWKGAPSRQRLEGAYGLGGATPQCFGRGSGFGVDAWGRAQGPWEPFSKGCLEKGLLVNVIGDKVLRLLPPLIVSDEEIDEALRLFELVCEECASECQDSAS